MIEPIVALERLKEQMILVLILLIGLTTLLNLVIMVKAQHRARFINQGIITAFFISFFVEMWGFVIAIYSIETLIMYQAIDEYTGFRYSLLLDPEQNLLYSSQFDFRFHYVVNIGKYFPYILCPIGVTVIIIGWIQVYRAMSKDKLCTTGLYKYIRNPQYLGFIIFLLGWNLQYPLLISWIIFPYFLILYLYLVTCEEKQLTEKFREEYLKYKSRTKRFIPFLF
ncbi:MAG: isoprenylcysteine carboxylmethyltransferase family protein [Candidatus Helarchaeota archaeon]|nr:isoprenylcysteine carboxylmethyltransferase family protein [Candidatus Helarchaeota archaeon]